MATMADILGGTSAGKQRIDARSKILLLLAFSLGLFFLRTWSGLGIFALVCLVLVIAAQIPGSQLVKLLIPLYVILFIMWACNAFVLDIYNIPAPSVFADVSTGFAAGMAPVAIFGTFGFSPEGCMRGLYLVSRIILLFIASLIVTYTTSSNQLVNAFSLLLKPLRAVKFPVDDLASILALSLRFIPMTANKYEQIRAAQIARGASFGTGRLMARVKGFLTALIPLFVGMFKKADNIASAMEARCYGYGIKTSLVEKKFSAAQAFILVVGLAFCVVVAALF